MTTAQLVAERLRGLEASPTLALAAKAKALRQAGKSVVDLTAGEPDFPTPKAVKDAAVRAIEQNQTRYTPVAGIPELRAALAAVYSRQLGVAYEPSQVIVSSGAKHSLYNALQAVCEPGDEVLLFSPFWVSYVPLIELAGAKAILIETREADRFQPDPEAVQRAITNRTKAVILNSPSNPTGMLIDEPRLQALAGLISRHGLVTISDEIYDRLVYAPSRARSIVQVAPELAAQTIVVNGASKAYSMTGWRIGYAFGPKPVMKAIEAFQSHTTSNPTSISQHAALAAVTTDLPELPQMVAEFQRRRDVLVNGLNALPGLSCVMPPGAFYAWCNIGRLGQPADAVATRWLDEALIAAIPGEGFGSPGHIRFSFATSMETIQEALRRLEQWLKQRT